MQASGRILRLVFSLSLVASLGGCTGFFVNPTLDSIAIGPTNQTITATPKQNLQMSATGTFNDGTTQDLTGKVFWSSSNTSCATVSTSGLVSPPTGAVPSGVCTASISAAKAAVASSAATITVSQGTPSVIMLTVNAAMGAVAVPVDSSFTVKALATFPNVTAPPDITPSCTWINSDPTDVMLTVGNTSGTVVATPMQASATLACQFANIMSNTVTMTFSGATGGGGGGTNPASLFRFLTNPFAMLERFKLARQTSLNLKLRDFKACMSNSGLAGSEALTSCSLNQEPNL